MNIDPAPYFRRLSCIHKELQELLADVGNANDSFAVEVEMRLLFAFLTIRKLDEHKNLPEEFQIGGMQIETTDKGHKDVKWLCDRLIHSLQIDTSPAKVSKGLVWLESDRDGATVKIETLLMLIENYAAAGDPQHHAGEAIPAD